MINTPVKQAVLYASDARGIYIPQHFAESFNRDMWQGYSETDIQEVLKGGESDCYWESWESILNDAETICGGKLHQDGDLWIVWTQLAIDAVNELCESQLEYEESHDDAGDAYAHMVAESWDSQKDSDLLRDLKSWSIDSMGLDSDVLSDIAIDLFVMQRGSIFGCYTDGIVLGAFPIQEIEIELEQLGIDAVTMDLIRESCDAYINDSGLAYTTTDAVWFAVVDPDAMQQAIIDYVEAHKDAI